MGGDGDDLGGDLGSSLEWRWWDCLGGLFGDSFLGAASSRPPINHTLKQSHKRPPKLHPRTPPRSSPSPPKPSYHPTNHPKVGLMPTSGVLLGSGGVGEQSGGCGNGLRVWGNSLGPSAPTNKDWWVHELTNNQPKHRQGSGSSSASRSSSTSTKRRAKRRARRSAWRRADGGGGSWGRWLL